MSRALPPLDLHAHVDPGIPARSLEELGAVVFVATRSLDEYEKARRRADGVTVWGVGCHPGVAAAQKAYDAARFAALVAGTPFVSEVGLDGSATVSLARQAEVFASILVEVSRQPRLVSVHSKRATQRTLDLIEQAGVRGLVLHWWLGSVAETHRAIELGCLFSVNRSMDVGKLKSAGVGVDALLPETDHPSGNRRGDGLRQPGWTIDVEEAVAAAYGLSSGDVRARFWINLCGLIDACGVDSLLPRIVRAMTAQARRSAPTNK